MKKFCFYILLSLLPLSSGFCAEPDYLTEAETLGSVAGEGLACQASKYNSYELLARAYITTKAPNNELLVQALKAYANAKINTFISNMNNSFADCVPNAARFDNQAIFKTILYGNGTLKTPDGKIIKPLQTYDASKLYQNNPNEREIIIQAYQKYQNKVLNDPAYQKVLRQQGL